MSLEMIYDWKIALVQFIWKITVSKFADDLDKIITNLSSCNSIT